MSTQLFAFELTFAIGLNAQRLRLPPQRILGWIRFIWFRDPQRGIWGLLISAGLVPAGRWLEVEEEEEDDDEDEDEDEDEVDRLEDVEEDEVEDEANGGEDGEGSEE
ncbi:hypothetical protein MMC15_002328 [Xylographa vitiligo]|nr:hypothetical protein [Xylographa vitiligo]